MRRALSLAAIVFATLFSAWSLSSPPPFDQEKARRLRPEWRHMYDVVLFNALALRDSNNRRYDSGSGSPDEPDASRRYLTDEIESMANDGHFLSHIALRLFDFHRGRAWQGDDAKAAMAQLIDAAQAGDESAICMLTAPAVVATVADSRQRQALQRRLLPARLASGHGGCLAYVGRAMLLGNALDIPVDRRSAMPRLFEAARQGYFVAASGLFHWRERETVDDRFDFANIAELDRALCWGRVATEFGGHGSFDLFLAELRRYARAHHRPDLVERGKPYDPRLVPPTRTVVHPLDCIALENMQATPPAFDVALARLSPHRTFR